MQAITADFERRNPDVSVHLRAPYTDYAEGEAAIVRQSMTGKLPDVHFAGFTQLPDLVERGLAKPLDSFLGGYGGAAAAGYIPRLLAISTFGDRIYGLPFITGTPIAYYNVKLLEAAGYRPGQLPQTWDQAVALAAAIHAKTGISGGVFADWDDWLFQALLDTAGGSLASPDGRRIAFDDENGLQALRALNRFIRQGGAVSVPADQIVQQFASGTVGIAFMDASVTSVLADQIKGRFELATGPFPVVDPRDSRGVPTGGAAATLLATDPARRSAAWRFIAFATGPEGQRHVVRFEGFPPVNVRTYEAGDVTAFFRNNPLRRPDVAQMRSAQPWIAFSGENAMRISRVIHDNVDRIVQQSATPEQVFADMKAEIEPMLQR
jgi:multiple sugar transport system substrate-binding protein